MGANTVLAPVSWGQLEPEEGAFDFRLVDGMLEEARRNGLRLVPLWFGAFKNAGSTYAPSWVRSDRDRFERATIRPKGLQAFTYQGAMAKPVLSLFSEALRDADARAFAELVQHLAEADGTGTVPMIQVENETGLLSDSRDRSAAAERAWRSPVPGELLSFIRDRASETSSVRSVWAQHGSRNDGSWGEVFGETWEGDEIFMAWATARYVEFVAARGREHTALPMYANAWLGPQPGQDEAWQYPSGGPGKRVLDLWRFAAPTLALIGPDIYVPDAEGAMRDYAISSQPFFVPECRPSAPELVRAIGTFDAVGWSMFGIDSGNTSGQVSQTLRHLRALESELAAARSRGELVSVVLETGADEAELAVGGTRVVARDTVALYRRMLFDNGISIPESELELPDETSADAAIQHAGDIRPFALIALDGDALIVVGRGVTLDFFDPRCDSVEIDRVTELVWDGERLIDGRELNGDERLRVLPNDRVGAVRIDLLRLARGNRQ